MHCSVIRMANFQLRVATAFAVYLCIVASDDMRLAIHLSSPSSSSPHEIATKYGLTYLSPVSFGPYVYSSIHLLIIISFSCGISGGEFRKSAFICLFSTIS